MADYFVIDADSHVEELEDAWNFLRENTASAGLHKKDPRRGCKKILRAVTVAPDRAGESYAGFQTHLGR
jgi:hypothetical protein